MIETARTPIHGNSKVEANDLDEHNGWETR